MDQQDDKIQQMIDEGLIFGPDENNPPRADAPLVKARRCTANFFDYLCVIGTSSLRSR